MIMTTWCSPVSHAYWKKELGIKLHEKSEQDNDSCSDCTVLAVYSLSQLPLEKLFCFAVFILYTVKLPHPPSHTCPFLRHTGSSTDLQPLTHIIIDKQINSHFHYEPRLELILCSRFT